MSNELEEIEKLLKSHDWLYSMSDDSRVFQKGQDESRKIQRICIAAEDQKAVKALWDKHCPLQIRRYYDGSVRVTD